MLLHSGRMEPKPRRSSKRQRKCRLGDPGKSFSEEDDGLGLLSNLFHTKDDEVPTPQLVVFTGSGISVSAGLSTFSSKQGLYAKAAKKFKLREGQELFRHRFLKSRPKECFRFFMDLYKECRNARPTLTHEALLKLEQRGNLVRHYTMNVDGLSSRCGLSLWDHSKNREGRTVELHGSLHELVCLQCKLVVSTRIANGEDECSTKAKQRKCNNCGAPLRFRVLMYDDEEGHLIHRGINPMDILLEDDLKSAIAVLWIGISFEQSASCEHFRKVWEMLRKNDATRIPCFLVNPDAHNVLFNLQATIGDVCNDNENPLRIVQSTSDGFFQQLLHCKT